MKSRWWPDTLFGRLVLILVAGMFAGQLLTGTIWFETRTYHSLDVPARLFASRVADTVRLLDSASDAAARADLTRRLSAPGYRLTWLAAAPATPIAGAAQRALQDLLDATLQQRTGKPVQSQLVCARLHDERARAVDAGTLALFDSPLPTASFHAQLRLSDGTWLDVMESGQDVIAQHESRAFVLGYLLRVYMLRLVAVLFVALIAVRLALRPLQQLADAAEALGANIRQPPLDVSGPREVRSAAQSFNTMQQRLIESIGARTRLLASISHDLRSPLTRLRLRTELLPDEAARERLRDDLDEMEAMVAATLDFAQSVEITEARRDIDMDSLLQGLASDAQEAGAHVDIRGRALKPLAGYPRNLKRCLQNLLDNAVRYGDGTVTITVTDHTHALQIVVGDNGPGLDHTLLERVFEPYFRSRATAGVSPGTGLGLTIARSIAHAHGGTLTLHTGACADDASDRACSGLHAVLTLPRARPTPHALHVAQ